MKFNPRVVASALVIVSASLTGWLVREEGVRYVPYYDTVGVKTVCMGSTRNVENRSYDKAECESLARKEIREFGEAVLTCVTVQLSQSEYEAYTSLAFNIGINAFCKSTLVKKLNNRDYAGACREILRWSAKQPELAPRRQREYQLCMTPVTEIKVEPDVRITVVPVPEDRGNWVGNRVSQLFSARNIPR